jgi:thiamine pyrophosphate-dependent acetolactate synthase large subunit-like protein
VALVTLNGAQVLVRLLLAEQVEAVYGIVGGKLGPLLHAISQQAQLRFLGVRHEAAGPMMAAAAYAGSGQIAVALGEMGPGGLNLASGLGVAFNNNLALLAITTNQHRAAAYPHSGMFMDLDTVAVTRPITKWNAVVHDARRLPEIVRRAFREALGGRPGPVHLDIPQDVLSQTCDFDDAQLDVVPAHYRALGRMRPDAQGLAQAAALMHGAKRPLIVVGGGVVTSDAAPAVRALAQRWGAPVLPTQMALGVVASDSPHFIGHGGLIAGEPVRQAFEQADLVLAVGCRWSSWMWDEHGPLARASRQPLVSINLDPSALGAPALHAVGLQADARAALDDLLALSGNGLGEAVERDWLSGLRQARAAYETRLASLGNDDEPDQPMHPAALARAIGEALPADALAVFDGGHTSFWSNDLTPVRAVRTRFHEPGMSHLGFGLPYAIALQAQQPGRAVALITGDGSFGFTLNELDTARRYRLPVLNIVHNNAAWGIIRAGQRNALGFEMGTALDETDYAAIARGFGCHGERVTAVEEVGPAIRRALASGLPAVLDCQTRFVPHPALPGFGSMNRYGFSALTGSAGDANAH